MWLGDRRILIATDDECLWPKDRGDRYMAVAHIDGLARWMCRDRAIDDEP